MIHRRGLFVSLVSALTCFATASPAEPVSIVTSIKPLELLVRAVAPTSVTVTTLVPAGGSPHTYQMRPSERQALAKADLVFWVGPDMETFLTRILGGSDLAQRTYALAPDALSDHSPSDHAPSDHSPPAHAHEERGHVDDRNDPQEAPAPAGHQHVQGEDPHVWLDPELALIMATTIHDRLADLPGMDQDQLDTNLANFRAQLAATEQAIRRQLLAARGLSLFTYHDAFGRFAEHYGLSIAGVLTPSPERTPGARHIAAVQTLLRAAERPCLLTEPQFNQRWWQAIAEGVDVKLSVWDPLAASIAAEPSGYLVLQQQMADAVIRCLPEHAQDKGNTDGGQ
ncbi:zinc ABC transporter substrate-binding protein [Marinobacter caseinilyticus]|uniref:zinc ABC transporter substrate-binding protein n=1 Tax=Marinobacter caseinilyticus TaxID=2692195 RepID=UPI00140A3F07|nr:zinc ABC transporter substrate-binding protein [Marinobacter caseinilyticus]